jgi:hypothetical protein
MNDLLHMIRRPPPFADLSSPKYIVHATPVKRQVEPLIPQPFSQKTCRPQMLTNSQENLIMQPTGATPRTPPPANSPEKTLQPFV